MKYSRATALSCLGMCGKTPLAMGKQILTQNQRQQSDFTLCTSSVAAHFLGPRGGQDDTQHMAAGGADLAQDKGEVWGGGTN